MGLILKSRPSGSVPTPAAGKVVIYADDTNVPRIKDPSGAVSPLGASASERANMRQGFANVLDFGADSTGQNSSETAITNALASLPAQGGVLYFPTGTYLTTSSPYVISKDQVVVRGAGAGFTTLKTNNTTGDQIRLTGYGSGIESIGIQGPGSGTTSNKTSGIGVDIQGTEGFADNLAFAYQFTCLAIQGHLVDVHDIVARYFNRTGIIVNHNSDHRITTVLTNNATATLPTGAGIDVQVTASLVLEQLNIINSNFALNISPASGVTVPSIKATDCFFDTSVVGLNMQGAGSVFRSEFTNCWFSTQSVAGIRMDPAQGGSVHGITFVNCDIYQNLGGTTTGVFAGANVGKWKMIGCSIAGWTTGLSLVPGSGHFPTILANTIGAVSAFAANGTGIVVGAGAYKGLVIAENDLADNTAVLSLGALTVAAASAGMFRIIDNAGINPRGAVTAPASAPVSTTVYTNTTGFRVLVMFKSGATAPTVFSINGVSSVLPLASQIVPVTLEPGGTIAATFTVAPTWTWIGQ